ncbi:ACT domain-containing protein [Lysobacter brunescens]|uniref:ACT domain-containing protein n=1 Tax=Lysobacter brunescens TaxID=262323 RepID=A0ABW2YCT0_9GAMM
MTASVGETDLQRLLAGLSPALAARPRAIRTQAHDAAVPAHAIMLFREDEGATVVVEAGEDDAAHADEPRWAQITLRIHSSLDAVGMMAAIATALAERAIPCNAVSAYFHDHLFVPWTQREDALEALRTLASGAGAIRVREAVDTDIPAMHAIRMDVRENTLSDPSWLTPDVYRAHLGGAGASNSWVCERDARILGFSVARQAQADIWALFVDPANEGQGIGRRLIAVATDWLFAQGVDIVSLSTAPDTRADTFYRANGWQRGEFTDKGEVMFRLPRITPPLLRHSGLPTC